MKTSDTVVIEPAPQPETDWSRWDEQDIDIFLLMHHLPGQAAAWRTAPTLH